MAGDLVMCEFRADHDVMKMCWRILSNNPHVTHLFEAGRRKREDKRLQLTCNRYSESESNFSPRLNISPLSTHLEEGSSMAAYAERRIVRFLKRMVSLGFAEVL